MQVILGKEKEAKSIASGTKFYGSKELIDEQFIQQNNWTQVIVQAKKMDEDVKIKRVPLTSHWIKSAQKIASSDRTITKYSEKTSVKIKLCSQLQDNW